MRYADRDKMTFKVFIEGEHPRITRVKGCDLVKFLHELRPTRIPEGCVWVYPSQKADRYNGYCMQLFFNCTDGYFEAHTYRAERFLSVSYRVNTVDFMDPQFDNTEYGFLQDTWEWYKTVTETGIEDTDYGFKLSSLNEYDSLDLEDWKEDIHRYLTAMRILDLFGVETTVEDNDRNAAKWSKVYFGLKETFAEYEKIKYKDVVFPDPCPTKEHSRI